MSNARWTYQCPTLFPIHDKFISWGRASITSYISNQLFPVTIKGELVRTCGGFCTVKTFIVCLQPLTRFFTSLTRLDPFSHRALSIRDKCPCEKGLVQVQYQTLSDIPAQAQGVNRYGFENQTFSRGHLSSLIDNALCEKGSRPIFHSVSTGCFIDPILAALAENQAKHVDMFTSHFSCNSWQPLCEPFR